MEGETVRGKTAHGKIHVDVYKTNSHAKHNVKIVTMTSITSFSIMLVLGNFCPTQKFPVIAANR